jgi:SAM-dependent methyltransferase
MLGLKDTFEYFECMECGTVQIVSPVPPESLAAYYPSNYYSFVPRTRRPLERWFTTMRDRGAIGTSPIAGRLLAKLRPNVKLQVLRTIGLKPSQRILDVGCGHGALLDALARTGFRNLLGIDPFLARDITTPAGVPILRRYLADVSGPFDVLMFNHSLEHVMDPVRELKSAAERLAPGGICIVRLPTSSSEAWETYRENWVQIDAPRHVFVPSRKGMHLLAKAAGLALTSVIDDSTAFQFWGSELYRRGICLSGPDPRSRFTRRQARTFARKARRANEAGRGDQAAFVLTRDQGSSEAGNSASR